MTSYEYCSVRVPTAKAGPDVSALNDLGANGWRAVAAVPAAMDGYAYQDVDGIFVVLMREAVEQS